MNQTLAKFFTYGAFIMAAIVHLKEPTLSHLSVLWLTVAVICLVEKR